VVGDTGAGTGVEFCDLSTGASRSKQTNGNFRKKLMPTLDGRPFPVVTP
jgi:hypothetical protein